MHSLKFFAIIPGLAFSFPGSASAIDALTVNTSPIASLIDAPQTEQQTQANPAVVHVQVLLDRAGSSPGVIDGYLGDNLTKAIAGFEAMRQLPVDGKLDADVIVKLGDEIPAIQPYEITEDDRQDIIGRIPEDYAEQAKMSSLGYTSVEEKLAERFHMHINLIKTLNPTAAFEPGETIAVAIPGDMKSGDVKRVEVHRKAGQAYAFAEDGSLIAVYPATIGSEESPSPTGTHDVKGVARMPTYTYNPKINFQQGNNREILKLPSGANGPVGTVWIDLTEPTYGIHGTPEPELIGKVGSHGCVRLTNWDVEELAGMVKPGVVVNFVD
ncbi:L,D-transpeptidase family protein [Agrobacterium cavarae]|uniref:L,D-transpeptidase family protein n=1 Tax=Agrobacterium cavarae TaxID=2528239 RepID=UPI003EE55C91